MGRKMVTIDGNEAVAKIAHKLNEVIAIYPITPSSPMGEWSDIYSAKSEKNIFGLIPTVMEMQSEGGASGAVHGALQAGALTTTFTSSQGLLLMIPNMYKIAGELTATVFHVAARSIAAQALSIFADHSDVMAVRQTGFALLSSNSVQEAMDFALIAQSATLKSRIPFLHFFDGFRTSHEVSKIEELSENDLKAMIDEDLVIAHRSRGLNPDNPVIRGTSQNPDVYFQGRESVNQYYIKTPEIVQNEMDKFASIVGRQYNLFDYVGSFEADRVMVIMGSGAEVVEECVEFLNGIHERVGVVKVRLYRPFSIEHFVKTLPRTLKAIAVLDRTKEVGATGEPLYLDVVNALNETREEFNITPKVIGGRYGLSSKEFTPAMVKAIFDELKKDKPKNHFTIGIIDDVTNSSLDYDENFSVAKSNIFRAMFYGLGADGTVGANKNTIKIIGEETDNYAQGYFVYDSKKSGSMTISHLRFGRHPIHSSYLINSANFIGCHQFVFLEKFNVLEKMTKGGIFLLNSPFNKDEVWDKLPRIIQEEIVDKDLKFFVIDAYGVANEIGLGGRINTIMQTCFFAISGVLPKDEAIAKIKHYIEKTYSKKGEAIVKMNFEAVDSTLKNLYEVKRQAVNSKIEFKEVISDRAPKFVKDVTATLIAGKGDVIPVSKMPPDGTWPTATTMWEKRNIANFVPVWDEATCIQCNKCVLVCPHATIRSKVYDKSILKDAPESFKYINAKGKNFKDLAFSIQVAVEDCTGCELCVESCPAKNKSEVAKKAINMEPQLPLREKEIANWEFFSNIEDFDRDKLRVDSVKESQFLRPLFEFSGACAGCGETPYVKLVSQLFGDRMVVANATGCSSIYGGNLPTTPWAKDANGRGPAWSNSLFEDNAEFGLGFRLSIDKHTNEAKELLASLKGEIEDEFVETLLNANQSEESGILAQRERVDKLKETLTTSKFEARDKLLNLADYLVKKSVWIIGGDGWAYDIGYGGLDHVIASGKNVNILVLDTEVYSNTGGQTSKATPLGAVAKFSSSGKPIVKKDLAMMAIAYGYVYVAKVAMGANDSQTIKALLEAERYDGPSIVIAYSHCIAHGYNLKYGMKHQKLAVESGYWPLFRYNPDLVKDGQNPFTLDSKPPTIKISDYMSGESRYSIVNKMNPILAKEYLEIAQKQVELNWKKYENLSKLF